MGQRGRNRPVILFGRHSKHVKTFPAQEKPWQSWTPIHQAINKTFGSKSISSLLAAQGRLWVGYGDYGANNGPTDVVSVGLDGDVQTHLSDVQTEAIFPYRELGGDLYAPWVDPKWYYGPGGIVTNAGGTWHSIEVPNMVHDFDVTKNSEGLWVSGSRLDDTDDQVAHPIVQLSRDGGQSWEIVFWEDRATAYSRIYNLCVVDDIVYAQDESGVSVKYVNGMWLSAEWPLTAPTYTNVARLGEFEYMGGDDGIVYRRKAPRNRQVEQISGG